MVDESAMDYDHYKAPVIESSLIQEQSWSLRIMHVNRHILQEGDLANNFMSGKITTGLGPRQ